MREVTTELDKLLHPRSIAVAGTSGNSFSMEYRYIFHLKESGYQGRVYPVIPDAQEILGYQSYPSLSDIPDTVDFVICCLPASMVFDLLADCPGKGVQMMHLFTARFSETGQQDAAEREVELLKRAQEHGVRLIGPNCMGIYHPEIGLSFSYGLPKEAGPVGMIMQSGASSIEFIHDAGRRGIRFSKVFSYGNALDIDETEILEYLTGDSATEIIACYIEGIRDGRRFYPVLRRAARKKPVIIMKAGRGSSGMQSAASHTAALAGSPAIWKTAIRQAGAVQAMSMEEMIDLVTAFHCLPPVTGTRVGILGGGGGKSVISADDWEEAGFTVAPFPPEIEDSIRKEFPELWWGWLRNPVDVSILPADALLGNFGGKVFRMMAESSAFDLVAANLTVGGPFSVEELDAYIEREVQDIIEIKREGIKPVVATVHTGNLTPADLEKGRWRSLAEKNAKLIEAGVPVFTNPRHAARIVMQLIQYYRRRASR